MGFATDKCVRKLSAVVDELEGDDQVAVAALIDRCTALRTRVIDSLTALLDTAPEELRAKISALIDKLSGQSDEQDDAIDEALHDDDIEDGAAEHLEHAKKRVASAIAHAIERLRELAEGAPDDVAAEFEQLATELEALLADVGPVDDDDAGEDDQGRKCDGEHGDRDDGDRGDDDQPEGGDGA